MYTIREYRKRNSYLERERSEVRLWSMLNQEASETKDKIKYTAGYMDMELKEEDLLALYIWNVLLENNKMDIFEVLLPLLNSEQWYIQILPNQDSMA